MNNSINLFPPLPCDAFLTDGLNLVIGGSLSMTLQEKLIEFYEYRKEIKKPIKEVSKKAFIRRLQKLSNNRESIMVEILDQSIANGWQGIFELRVSKAEAPSPVQATIDAMNQVINNINGNS